MKLARKYPPPPLTAVIFLAYLKRPLTTSDVSHHWIVSLNCFCSLRRFRTAVARGEKATRCRLFLQNSAGEGLWCVAVLLVQRHQNGDGWPTRCVHTSAQERAGDKKSSCPHRSWVSYRVKSRFWVFRFFNQARLKFVVSLKSCNKTKLQRSSAFI